MLSTIKGGHLAVFAVLAATALLCVLATSSGAAAGDVTLVSRDDSGAQGNGASNRPDISSDGRFVAFASSATNLVANDTNDVSDVFVRDLRPAPGQETTIERVSVGSAGGQEGNGVSLGPTISADGRYVAFVSGASNLVANDTNGKWDVFVHDRQTGANTRVNVSDSGSEANETSPSFPAPTISDSGRYVAFLSSASNLVANDTISQDVFVHDRDKDGNGVMDEAGQIKTERVSQSSVGWSGNGSAWGYSMSTDGRYVAFYDGSSDLVAGDTDRADIFVRDRIRGTLQRIRVDCSFSLCNTHLSNISSISDDGRFVAFQADATGILTGNSDGVDSLDDVFVYDRQTGTARRMSVNSCGTGANGGLPTNVAISSDGGYLTFQSKATNLVADDTNGVSDIFVRDLQGGTIERVSVGPAGVEADNGSSGPSISSEGRYVAFTSGATNLVAGDANGASDVFVHERGGAPQQQSECVAPTTTASAITSGGATYESDTWTNETVEVTLSAQENEGGSRTRDIRYSATGAQTIASNTVAGDSASVPIDAEGITTISFFATDNEGNVEYPKKTFTVKISRDAPTVDSVYPADAATDIPPKNHVESTFSEAMDPDTINASTFILTKQGSYAPVAATVGYDAATRKATLDPNSELAPNTTYTATIRGGASGATDLAGDALEQDYSWIFTTGADTTPPETFIDTGPSGTVRSTTDSFSFSSNEREAAFKCKLDGVVLDGGCTSPKTVPEARIPEAGILAEGTHTFEVWATDKAGNTDLTPASRRWTVDTTAPRINTVSPADQSRNVSSDTNVGANFAEEMNSSSVNASTFILTKQGSYAPVAATVGYDSTTRKATLDPSSDLAPSATFTATIVSGSNGVKDLAGNSLGQNRSWTFTTAPPSVVSYKPTEATSAPRNIRPTATFSTNMDPSTVTATNIKFEVYDTQKRAWVSVSHSVSYDATSKTATVSPDSPLAASRQYRVTVTTNVKSSTGVALDQDASTSGNQPRSWTFTTGTLFAYSAVGDFSATQNPSGAWSYGYRASAGSGLVLYASHARPWGPSFDQWSLYDSPYATPHVTYNRSGQTAEYSTITHPPDVLNLHPGNSGQKSVVRWTAPSSATIKIEGRFEGIDRYGTTTDVAVVKNMATSSVPPLFSGTIDGYYGEDKAPLSAATPFSFTTSVRAGDTIEFVVGYGSNANHGFDSTGLSATITY
jgi:Bacterial Ig-like domain/WD40-like Beta Propeller Repeat